MKRLHNMDIIILTHHFAHGPYIDLETFLKQRTRSLTSIYIPLYSWQKDKDIIIKVFYGNSSEKAINFTITPSAMFKINYDYSSYYLNDIWPPTWIVEKMCHVLIMAIETMYGPRRYDIAICQDPLTTVIALALKRLGKVDYVLFQSHNFTAPERNKIYKFLDYYATRKADVVWCLSKRLCKIRKEMGQGRVLHVPVTIDSKALKLMESFSSAKENALIYVGKLDYDKGVDILIKILPSISPLFDRVYIIGDGALSNVLANVSKKLENIKLLGKLPLDKSLMKIRRSLLGIMLSRPSLELITTDPLKPKLYLAGHTAVILPYYVELAEEVNGIAGLAINPFKEQQILKSVKLISKDPDKFLAGAEDIAKRYSYWSSDVVFEKAFKETFHLLGLE